MSYVVVAPRASDELASGARQQRESSFEHECFHCTGIRRERGAGSGGKGARDVDLQPLIAAFRLDLHSLLAVSRLDLHPFIAASRLE